MFLKVRALYSFVTIHQKMCYYIKLVFKENLNEK